MSDHLDAFEFYNDPAGKLYLGHVLDVLEAMPDESVQTVVTSPPYWGLRDYGTGTWTGGDPECKHILKACNHHLDQSAASAPGCAQKVATIPGRQFNGTCKKCGAVREDKQLGLEATPTEYIANMVEILAEIWRVLRKDGTVWLNIGDSYASGKGTCFNPGGGASSFEHKGKIAGTYPLDRGNVSDLKRSGLKQKDLCLVPARLAIALQDAGWWVRSIVIWHKRNPMPESVTDRPTTAHEYVLLLAKSGEPQFWVHRDRPYIEREYTEPAPDWRWKNQITGEEVREEPADWETATYTADEAHAYWKENHDSAGARPFAIERERAFDYDSKQNAMKEADGNETEKPKRLWKRRNLWRGCDYYYDHAAIAEPCVTPLQEKVVPSGWDTGPGGHSDKVGRYDRRKEFERSMGGGGTGFEGHSGNMLADGTVYVDRNKRTVWTTVTRPYKGAHFATFPPELVKTCILAGAPEGRIVLDPFMGSGTVAQAARDLNRNFLGIDLKEEYLELARKRLQQMRLAI